MMLHQNVLTPCITLPIADVRAMPNIWNSKPEMGGNFEKKTQVQKSTLSENRKGKNVGKEERENSEMSFMSYLAPLYLSFI